MILEGRVRVNGRIVLLPYLAVDPEKDDVWCDGRRAVPSAHVYVAMNKPVGVVSPQMLYDFHVRELRV